MINELEKYLQRLISFLLIITLSFGCLSCIEKQRSIQQEPSIYDFSFAELAVEYFETNDSSYVSKIAETKAATHLLAHARKFNYEVPTNSELGLVNYLLNSEKDKTYTLEDFKRNLKFAKELADTNIIEQTCLKFLPAGFRYSGKLFFTYGYDIGVVYNENASVNLAHPLFLDHRNEIKYYAIHELHHAGFVTSKGNYMPSLNINNYEEIAELIEYYTHLEGMGTYAPLNLRINENAMNQDKDYVALQDSVLMIDYEKEFFEIYFHFKQNPDSLIKASDWEQISILSDEKRLWYRVGAHMAQAIDKYLGREKLISLINEPSKNFITTYLELSK